MTNEGGGIRAVVSFVVTFAFSRLLSETSRAWGIARSAPFWAVMLMIIAAMALVLALRVLGCVLFGVRDGYRLVALVRWPFELARGERGLRLRRTHVTRRTLHCLLEPPGTAPADPPDAAPHLGGAWLCTLVSLVCLLLLFGRVAAGALGLFLAVLAMASASFAVLDRMPGWDKGVPSVGQRLCELKLSPLARQAEFAAGKTIAWRYQRRNLGELPEEWFALPEPFSFMDADAVRLMHLCALWLTDSERDSEAQALLHTLIVKASMDNDMELDVRARLLIYQLAGECDRFAVALACERGLIAALKRHEEMALCQLALYGHCLVTERDGERAAEWREALLDSLGQPDRIGSGEFERRMLTKMDDKGEQP